MLAIVADAAAPRDAAVANAGMFVSATTPEVRALGAALDKVDVQAATDWLGSGERPLHPGVKPPPDLAAASDALIAWDEVGSPLRFECEDRTSSPHQFALLYTARAMLARATRKDDPALHAALHLAQELRRSGGGEVPVRMGITIAVFAARWAAEHAPHEKLLTRYAIEPTAAIEVARAQARCNIVMFEHPPADMPALHASEEEWAEARRKRGMPPGGDDRIELPTLIAYWRETLRQLDAVQTLEELRRVVAARVAEADQHPTSVLVRSFGHPVPMIANTLEWLDEYRELSR